MKIAGEENKERGEFIAAEVLQGKYRDDDGITEGDITLTAVQVNRVWNSVICPCGQCGYYSVEFFKDGKFVVHHNTKGVMSEGNFLK